MTEILKLVPRKESRNKETIGILEEWLERARNGEIVQVALVGLTFDGGTLNCYTSMERPSAILGGVEQLKYRILVDTYKVEQYE